MAHKTGFSHGSSALVGLLVAELLVHYCRPAFPAVLAPLENGAGAVSRILSALFGVPFRHDVFVFGLVAAVLSFVWGVVYHRARHG